MFYYVNVACYHWYHLQSFNPKLSPLSFPLYRKMWPNHGHITPLIVFLYFICFPPSFLWFFIPWLDQLIHDAPQCCLDQKTLQVVSNKPLVHLFLWINFLLIFGASLKRFYVFWEKPRSNVNKIKHSTYLRLGMRNLYKKVNLGFIFVYFVRWLGLNHTFSLLTHHLALSNVSYNISLDVCPLCVIMRSLEIFLCSFQISILSSDHISLSESLNILCASTSVMLWA